MLASCRLGCGLPQEKRWKFPNAGKPSLPLLTQPNSWKRTPARAQAATFARLQSKQSEGRGSLAFI